MGLSWVHSTYPNYKLGGTYSDSMPDRCTNVGGDCGNYGYDYYSEEAVDQFSWDEIKEDLPAWMQGDNVIDSLANSVPNFWDTYNPDDWIAHANRNAGVKPKQ